MNQKEMAAQNMNNKTFIVTGGNTGIGKAIAQALASTHAHVVIISRMGTYANTKLCNVLFTREMAKRIKGSGITINAVHPGVIRTNLGNTSGVLGLLLRLVKRTWSTPEEGAMAPVWLATSPEVEGVNGQYFNLKEATTVNDTAQDEVLGQKLWDLSATLAGIN